MKHKARGGAHQPIHLYFVIITDYPHITTALPFAGEKGEDMRLIDADALEKDLARRLDATDWGLEHDFENHGWDMDRTVKACLHMVGHGRSKEYYRHGKRYMKAYRNYWYGKMRDDFEYMCRKTFGYMERTVPSDDGYVYYSLTEEGLKWLGRKTKMIIKETD